jgi:hypothetical protein
MTAATVESIVGTLCPSCTRRHTKACIDGGRCVNCFTSLSGITMPDLPTFTIETPDGPLTVHAENEAQARRAYKLAVRRTK